MSKEQNASDKESELTKDERELILKALSYYQVHLFDEMSKKAIPDASLDADYRKTEVVIRKINKPIEH
ncbi:MAG: hypothetical protein ABSE82_02075 [Nitrososphaerales archaeon]